MTQTRLVRVIKERRYQTSRDQPNTILWNTVLKTCTTMKFGVCGDIERMTSLEIGGLVVYGPCVTRSKVALCMGTIFSVDGAATC